MSETIDGNTIRAESIMYHFDLHRWIVVYLAEDRMPYFFKTKEVGPEATLQEVFNLLIQEIKKK